MAFYLSCKLLKATNVAPLQFVRHKFRGKPPGIARSLKQRIEELNYKDELYSTKIDIGLPGIKSKRAAVVAERIKIATANRKNPELVQQARKHSLQIDLNDVKQEWLKTQGPTHIKTIAEHYGIFEHLYSEGYFYPRVALEIGYEQGDGTLCPVYYGNVVKPREASQAPLVTFPAEDGDLWSLCLTSLDGHLTDNNKEYLHWFVANIPGNDVSRGQMLVKYLQPIPPRGTGYHRYVFILYKQTKKMDLSLPSGDTLDERTFYTRDWYSKYQDDVTPAGLAFFQSDWDYTLKDVYHNILNITEPVYEYDFPKPYIKKQTWFPKKQPFNIYMDRYRDQKQVNKEYLMRVLKDEHPFNGPPRPLKYPNAHPLPHIPSWLKLHERKVRMHLGRINEID